MLRARCLAGLLTVALGPLALAESPSPLRKPLLGQTPPELVAGKDDWLAGPAVSLQKLKGKVVWLQFNF
jgi:hypothetical protein